MGSKLPETKIIEFESLNPAARRILIAHDALALLEAKAFFVGVGLYVDHNDDTLASGLEELEDDQQLNVILEMWLGNHHADEACAVCAIGATLVAAVRRFNDLTVLPFKATGLYGQAARTPITTYLERFFEPRQLAMIEAAFEQDWLSCFDDVITMEEYRRCRDFSSITHHATRLKEILKNIITNNGEFIP